MAESQNLLFDLDGTLTDSEQGILTSISHALLQMNVPVPEIKSLRRFIGPPIKHIFRDLVGDDDGRIEEGISHYRERYARVGLFESHVYDGIPECLTALSLGGHRLFVCTSKPTVYAERIVAHFGLDHHFHGIYGCELNGDRSDKAELIAHLIASETLVAAKTVMIGDREHDVKGALANGVAPTGVLWGFGSREELITAGAQRVFAKPSDLSSHFAGGVGGL